MTTHGTNSHRIEELDWLLSCGETPERAAHAVGWSSLSAATQAARRARRLDLARQIEIADKATSKEEPMSPSSGPVFGTFEATFEVLGDDERRLRISALDRAATLARHLRIELTGALEVRFETFPHGTRTAVVSGSAYSVHPERLRAQQEEYAWFQHDLARSEAA